MSKTLFQENILKPASNNYSKTKQFCNPLATHFGIDYFYYYKMTKDGYFSLLTNYIPFTEKTFDNDLHKIWPYNRDYFLFESGIRIFSDKNPVYSPVLNFAKQSYNLNVIFQVLNKTSEFFEGFIFGSSKDPIAVTENCLSEINLIHLFIKQFKGEFSKQLQSLENYQVSMKEELGAEFFNNLLQSSTNALPKEKFLATIGFKNFDQISDREKQVIHYMLKGYSAGETANALFISKRTVETHIENIKNKLDCHSKIEVIDKCSLISPIII